MSAAGLHYALKLDYGLPTERIVLFATQAERLQAARAILRAERRPASSRPLTPASTATPHNSTSVEQAPGRPLTHNQAKGQQ
jgi:hypothetical protein